MPDAPPTSPQPTPPQPAPPPRGHPWASIRSPLSASDALARAAALAKDGKLPGFAPVGDGSFTITAFGQPLDYDVHARPAPATGTGPAGSDWTFVPSLQRKLPIIMGVVTLLTIWPGVWITDSMLRTYFPAYDFKTWMWYIPLTVVPLPFAVVRMFKRSRDAAHAHALEKVALLRTAWQSTPR